MIFVVTIVIVWVTTSHAHVRKQTSLNDGVCTRSDCPTDWRSLSLSLSSGSPIAWNTTISKLGQLITLKRPVCVQVSLASLTLNQKLEMSEPEETVAYHDRPEARPPAPSSHIVKANDNFWRTLNIYSGEYTNGKRVKQPYCWYGESFSGLLDRGSNRPSHKQSLGQSKALTPFNSVEAEKDESEKWKWSHSVVSNSL